MAGINTGRNFIQVEVGLTTKSIDVYIPLKRRILEAEFLGLPNSHESYTGEYEVVPKFEEQILNTNGKLMRDDVDVLSIPVVYTDNISGGSTAYIGG